MRLAILPITSFRNLSGESEIVMFSAMIRQWVHDHEDCWLYLILPEDCEEQGWVGLREEWPRTTVLWTDRLGLYYDKIAEIPANFMTMFNARNGRYQLDALVTSRRAAGVEYARQLWDHRLKKTLPVFIDESHSVEWGRTSATVSDIEIVAQTLSAAVCWPVWDTEVEKEKQVLAARHWLAGKRIWEVMQKGVVIPCGFDPSRVAKIAASKVDPMEKEEKFTCFFGGRLNRGAKRADVLIREYDTFFRYGREIDITICSPKDEGWMMDMIRKEYPEIRVLVATPSDEFVLRASRAHVFLNTSMHEGFSVGFAEMMFMTKFGTVLIAPRLPWVRGMFQEKFDEYPFLYEDFEQARVMLRWIHENYEEAVEKTSWLGDWVAEAYDSKRTYEEHFEHYRKVIDEEMDLKFARNLMSAGSQELVLGALEKMDETFELDVLYREMIDQSRAMKEDPRRGQTTKLAVRLWLMRTGQCVDTYTSALPMLRKVENAPAVAIESGPEGESEIDVRSEMGSLEPEDHEQFRVASGGVVSGQD